MSADLHRSLEQLEAGLDRVRAAPRDRGTVALVVRRPAEGEREVLTEGQLDLEHGLVGDNWQARGSKSTADGSAHPDMQLNLTNARVSELIAAEQDRWALAGDQLHVDLDLSFENLPTGTRLQLGTAVIEVTEIPHNGCKKFAERFGHAALRFVNAKETKALRLRGINAKVVTPGVVRPGDTIAKQ